MFEQFQTIRYLAIYFVILLVANVVIAKMIYIPQGFGLLEILARGERHHSANLFRVLGGQSNHDPAVERIGERRERCADTGSLRHGGGGNSLYHRRNGADGHARSGILGTGRRFYNDHATRRGLQG